MQVYSKLHLGRFILHWDGQIWELLYNTAEKWPNKSRPESSVKEIAFRSRPLLSLLYNL